MSSPQDNKRPAPSSAVTDSNKKPKPSPFARKNKPKKLDLEPNSTNYAAPPLYNTVSTALTNPKINSISYICLRTPDVAPMVKDENGDITVQNPGIVLILGHNYTERLLTQPYYMRNTNTPGHSPLYLNFIEVMGCHPKVYKVCDPRTNGREYLMRQYPDPKYPGNFKSTNCQVIGIGIPNGATWDNGIHEFHKDTVVPAIMQLQTTPICKNAPKIPDNDEPVHYIETLSQCLVEADILELVTGIHASYDEDDEEGRPTTLEEFFKKAKGNLYMCWPPGEVPMRVMQSCQLGHEHLEEADWTRLYATFNKE
jgi:hypothetical protein